MKKESDFEPIKPIEGERIEDKMRRVIDNKEPITDGAPIIYTKKITKNLYLLEFQTVFFITFSHSLFVKTLLWSSSSNFVSLKSKKTIL